MLIFLEYARNFRKWWWKCIRMKGGSKTATPISPPGLSHMRLTWEDFAGSAWFWRVRGAQKANKNETAKKLRIQNFFHFADHPWSWFLISSKPQFHLWTLSLISPSIVTSFYLFYTLLLYSSGLPFGDKYEHANTNTTMEVNKYNRCQSGNKLL